MKYTANIEGMKNERLKSKAAQRGTRAAFMETIRYANAEATPSTGTEETELKQELYWCLPNVSQGTILQRVHRRFTSNLEGQAYLA